MKIWLYTLVSVFLVSIVSLLGIISITLKREKLSKILLFLVSFAVGGLFGDAFLHLLPESFEALGANVATSLYVIAGILLFFVIESFLHWRHCHNPSAEGHLHPVATLNLVGDAAHNMIDGMIIAASYLVSIPLGIATTLAVVFHEIPQEIGDFAILLHAGLSIPRALFLNFISALCAFIGAAITLIIGPYAEHYVTALIPIAAGGFIYIAGSDLIPALHDRCDVKFSTSLWQFVLILFGVGVMGLLLLLE